VRLCGKCAVVGGGLNLCGNCAGGIPRPAVQTHRGGPLCAIGAANWQDSDCRHVGPHGRAFHIGKADFQNVLAADF